MTAVMVQGCTSWAGKSLLTTALCRWYADQGLRVAPFKGQNMSNNSRVVAGGELGVAQWLQARAARVEPDVRMGPVLVKPERRTSQVVVLGQVDDDLSRTAWTRRPPHLWPVITAALDELLAEFDLVVCEGAGSPAETNLRDTDLANMRVAHHADAPVLLVADINRGGAFAHLFGTWALVGDEDRQRLAGFVLNRFRGDPALLGEGPAELAARTGMACAGLLPELPHVLPDEDGARDLAHLGPADGPTVAVVRYPAASNLDELLPLATAARVRWATDPAHLRGAALVVLPGSKHVSADLEWMRARGLDAAVVNAAQGGRVLGVCGGLQMLGVHRDATGGRSHEASGPGLGLLPVLTTYAPHKLLTQARTVFARDLPAPWAALAGLECPAYDIRDGRTAAAGPSATPALRDNRGWVDGNVLGIACHGVLEDPAVVTALVGRPPRDDGTAFAELAAAVDDHLDPALLRRLTGGLL